MGSISPINNEDLKRALERPQNQAIIKFLENKDWVEAEDISSVLGINVTLTLLYLSDLEKVGLLVRSEEMVGPNTVHRFKLASEGLTVSDLVSSSGGALSREKISEAIELYIRIYSSLINKLDEVGGKSTLKNIVDMGIERGGLSPATDVVSSLEKGSEVNNVLKDFNDKFTNGELQANRFPEVKGDFRTFRN